MKVSIVIAAYNAEATLRECLDACAIQTHPAHEVIVVDDGSTDATRTVFEQFKAMPGSGNALLLDQSNAGPAAARNRGAAAATGDILAFTDSDCIPAPGWLAQLLAGFVDDSIAGVGGTYGIANPHSLLARMIHEEIVMRHERMGADVDFLGSFNVAYRKSFFDTVGGFDESFRAASGEDNDLAYRIQDHGGQLRFTRHAVVAHYHPQRLGPYLRTQCRHGYWRVKLYTKHAGRARGDRYAGLGDLMAPNVAFTLLMLSIFTLINPHEGLLFSMSALFTAATFLVYLALQVWKGVPMSRRIGLLTLLAFPALLFLRDIARELGVFRGVWDFNIVRKGMN
jgi:glycosyltransferase involved in cell wall biosynthesis